MVKNEFLDLVYKFNKLNLYISLQKVTSVPKSKYVTFKMLITIKTTGMIIVWAISAVLGAISLGVLLFASFVPAKSVHASAVYIIVKLLMIFRVSCNLDCNLH